jgi:hypothetical protein
VRTEARLLLQNIASPLTEDRECDQPFGIIPYQRSFLSSFGGAAEAKFE